MAPEMTDGRPRVLIVSPGASVRTSQYHLELLVRYGAAPVIVPRIAGVDEMLDGFEPIHGVLLCEGEDVNLSTTRPPPRPLRRGDRGGSPAPRRRDRLRLQQGLHRAPARQALPRPPHPLARHLQGSQVLNVAAGGTLHQDVAESSARRARRWWCTWTTATTTATATVSPWWRKHRCICGSWSAGGGGGRMEMMARGGFVAMGFAGDGLVEVFYDPAAYDPGEGEFLDFVRAATAYQRKTKRRISWSNKAWKTGKINDQMVGAKLRLQHPAGGGAVGLREWHPAGDLRRSGGVGVSANAIGGGAGSHWLQSRTAAVSVDVTTITASVVCDWSDVLVRRGVVL
ncbi:unnamed protein product [Spirodela intermedia]|uniref:Uncharacterized protein n=1 Tax=Spirodela intermedia TaxID=51605 RepID=A0ABN7E9Y2_SPIIN|nr:unnamed protein product [Spirodela intermedia]